MSKAQISMWEEKIVDSFAGGGGASTGIELATGRVVDIAINHDPDAILMHKTNHPHTVHSGERNRHKPAGSWVEMRGTGRRTALDRATAPGGGFVPGANENQI